MVALEITLHTLWAEHAAVKWKLLPRLEADDSILTDLQLDSTLLSAKAAMCLDQLLGRMDRFIFPPTGWDVVEVWPKLFFEGLFGDRSLSHSLPLSTSIARVKVIYVCRRGIVPASCLLAQTSNSSSP